MIDLSNLSTEELTAKFLMCKSLEKLALHLGVKRESLRRYLIKIGFDYHSLKKRMNQCKCLYCGADIKTKYKHKFCSSSCSALHNNPKKERKYKCLKCGKPLCRKGKYCSQQCHNEWIREQYIQKVLNNETDGCIGKLKGLSAHIRNFLLDKYQNTCQKCGCNLINPYSNTSILEVHHIDGNCTNNKLDNLQLLCPNCHKMTDNFGARNKHCKRPRYRVPPS